MKTILILSAILAAASAATAELDEERLVENCGRDNDAAKVKQMISKYGKDAIFDARAAELHSCLSAAVESGFREVVSLLIEEGVDVNQRLDIDRTPIFYAGAATIDLLLDAGADIRARDAFGWTALHRCAVEGVFRNVQPLVDAGAEIDARDDHEETPLRMAIFWGWAEDAGSPVVTILLKNGASLGKAKDSSYGEETFEWALEDPKTKAAIAEGLRLAGKAGGKQ